MKSSETPTDAPDAPGAGESLLDRIGGRADLAIHAGLFVVGALLILHVNGWRLTPPVGFLIAGWVGILVAGQFLWKTAMVAAAEGDSHDDEGFEVTSSRRDDLLREKRSVLKAIKEIEFDHAMDKMSREDADELLARYRRRAIALIKELEGGDAGSIDDIIDREVKARLAVDGASKKGKKKKKAKAQRSGAGADAGQNAADVARDGDGGAAAEPKGADDARDDSDGPDGEARRREAEVDGDAADDDAPRPGAAAERAPAEADRGNV